MCEQINILCQSSDFYCPFCGIMLESLFYNNTDIETIKVYLISDDIGDENLKRLGELSQKYGREIKIINGDLISKELEKLGCPKYNASYATYYKLFISQYINDDIDRLLYLDSDIIVNGSLKELFTMDLHGKVLGMAYALRYKKHRKTINLSSEYEYACGINLYDFKKWRKEKCTEKIMLHLKNVRSQYPFVDEDIINIVLDGEIMNINLKYYFVPDFTMFKDCASLMKTFACDRFYSNEEFALANREPVIIHYVALFSSRPWCKKSHNPMVDIWDQYMNSSLWNDISKIDDTRNLRCRISGILFKIFPRFIYRLIYRLHVWCLEYVYIKKYNL